MMRFTDKRVLVTGSSRNTGLGIAQAFAREGARVVINGTNAENVAAAVGQVLGSVPAMADLSTLAGVQSVFAVVEAEWGGLDVLVNNAVHLGLGPTFTEAGDDLLVELMAVNVLGYYRCAQAGGQTDDPRRGSWGNRQPRLEHLTTPGARKNRVLRLQGCHRGNDESHRPRPRAAWRPRERGGTGLHLD